MITWANSTISPSATANSATRPGWSDTIRFIIFMASMIPISWLGSTASPTSTKGLAPGSGQR